MRTRYKINDTDQVYFITFTTIEWIPVFTRKSYIDILINSWIFCRNNKGLKLFSYAILDNHLHLVVSANNLSDIIKDLKRHTAREIINLAQKENKTWLLNQFKFHKKTYKANSDYQVWQEGFHPKQITSETMLRQKIEYIHHNPVRTGLVDKAEDWCYSSARNYQDIEAILEIDLVEL